MFCTFLAKIISEYPQEGFILNLCSCLKALLLILNIFIFFFHRLLSQLSLIPSLIMLNLFFGYDFLEIKTIPFYHINFSSIKFVILSQQFEFIYNMLIVIMYLFHFIRMFFLQFMIIFYNNLHFSLMYSQFQWLLIFTILTVLKLH